MNIGFNAEIGTVAGGNESGIGVLLLNTAATAVSNEQAILLVDFNGVHEHTLLTVQNCSSGIDPLTVFSIASFSGFVKGFLEKIQIFTEGSQQRTWS
jgi:hypothetical protein